MLMPATLMPQAPHPQRRAADAHARMISWHKALDADALGAGAVGALWQGAWTDAWMLTHAQRVRPKLDAPFAVIDAICGVPRLEPLPHQATWWRSVKHAASLLGLSIGLAAKCLGVYSATAASIGAFFIEVGRAAWAHLRAYPDAPNWQTLWTRAAGSSDSADLVHLAALVMGLGATSGIFEGDAQSNPLAELLSQDASRFTHLLMRLCQHPQAALTLWRWAQRCRSWSVQTPDTPLWTLLGQIGVDGALRDALLRWGGDGLEAFAQTIAYADGARSAEVAALWESALRMIAQWLGSEAQMQAQSQLHDCLATWLEAHATDAEWMQWCAQGTTLLSQCKADLLQRIEEQGPMWPTRLASLQAMCPPLVWTLLGRAVGIVTQPSTTHLQRLLGMHLPADDAPEDDALLADAAWLRWLSDARAEPMWRALAEVTDLARQIEGLGQTLLAAMPHDTPDSPWRLMWAAARDVMARQAPAQPGLDKAQALEEPENDLVLPRIDPYLQQSVRTKHGYVPPRPKTSLAMLLWPEATTVVSKAGVDAFYKALRKVHARQLGTLLPNSDDACISSAGLEVAANFLIALGQVLAVRTQHVPQLYCNTGRLNIRRYLQASLRPASACHAPQTYYDRRVARRVRSRALRFTIVAPGKLHFDHQSPWALLGDVMDGHRRIAAPWRDVAHTFVVLEALFTGSEAEWNGLPNLLEPLSQHLRLAERRDDTWCDKSQNTSITKDAGNPKSALAKHLRLCVQQSMAKPPRDELALHKAPAHEVGVWLMTPEQAPDVWAHEQRLMQTHRYFSAVGVIMGEAEHLPAALREAYIILPSPDAGLIELAGRIEAAFVQLQAADDAWDESCTTG